jgi:RNA polymerase sigma-70 factor (ECF subfamily)
MGTTSGIVGDVDEAELLHRARHGDDAAFAQLFGRYQRAIFRYASHMCGDATADDVVQDTFVIVLRRGSKFDATRGTFSAFLFGIARNVILKHLGNRAAPLEDLEGAAEASSAHADALASLTEQERIAAVRAAIASLPPLYREVVALCDLEEMDYESAASALGCPIGTIRSRLHRARAMLTSKLAGLRGASRI